MESNRLYAALRRLSTQVYVYEAPVARIGFCDSNRRGNTGLRAHGIPPRILIHRDEQPVMKREADLNRLYDLFTDLEKRVDGKQRLGDCTGCMDWPDRGAYLVFAEDEDRDTGDQARLTRIGTHAVSSGSGTSLWNDSGHTEERTAGRMEEAATIEDPSSESASEKPLSNETTSTTTTRTGAKAPAPDVNDDSRNTNWNSR